MDRKTFIEGLLSTLALGTIFLIGGCGKEEKTEVFGNEDKLWQMANGEGKLEEPVELAYAKKTPALFRDASMGKADPSFVPKVSGG
jgi:hypothetical protein